MPGRARAILTRAQTFPSNQGQQVQSGLQRVPEATLQKYPAVASAFADWEEVRKELQPLVELGKP